MSIDIACRNCGRVIYAPEHSVGKEMTCPGCSKLVRVVRPHKVAHPDEVPVPATCPACEASIRLVPTLLGRRVYCNACGTFLEVTLALRRIEKSDTAAQKQFHRDTQHEDDRPEPQESDLFRAERPEATPIKPPPLPLPEDSDYGAEPDNEEHAEVVQHGDASHAPQEDLVFGLPEITEEPSSSSLPQGCSEDADHEPQAPQVASHTPLVHEQEYAQAVSDLDLDPPEFAESSDPASIPTSGYQETSTRTQPKPAADRTAVEQEDDHSDWSEDLELDLPESEVAPPQRSTDASPSTSPPLTSHEVALAQRDQEIGAALRLIQSGGYVPEVSEPTPQASTVAPGTPATTDQTPPWLWPLITAAAATCAMVAAIYYILYVL